MGTEVAKPFVATLVTTLEMMAGIQVKPEPFYVKEEIPTPGDVSGVIGFAGKYVLGSIALKFPNSFMLKVFSGMTGEEIEKPNQEVYDTMAELANIIAGGGKTTFAQYDIHFNLAIPYVAIGKDHEISYGVDENIVVAPLSFGDEKFYMEIMMKKVNI